MFLASSTRPVNAADPRDGLSLRNFLVTYRAALERLQVACSSGYLKGVYTSQWFGAKTDTPEREATLFMAYGSDGEREKHVLIRRNLVSVPYFERVFLPRNGRTLILERIDPVRPFYIRWISKPSEAPDNLAPSDRRDVVARAAYAIGVGYLLPSILESPSFQLVEAGHVNREGASFVRAAFKTQADPKASLPEMEGWLLLEPARDWALRSHEVRIALPASPKYHSVVSGTVLYADDAGSGPLPQEVNLVDRFTNEGRAGEHRIHFRARHRTAVAPPAADFTLAGYDLADYPWDTEARRDSADRASSRSTRRS